jgi:outer membrane protein OmpA-like peptidoglycan-associated protein/Tol biopolymer transport system component/predicted negative regulator of RcsB-dependent stress response
MLKYWIVILFLLGLAAGVNAQEYVTKSDANSKALKYFDEARSMLRRQDFSSALTALNQSLKKEPTFIDALLMKADIELQQKDFSASEQSFERALELAPDYAALAFLFLAEAETGLQKYEEAITHAQAYLDTNPRSEKWKKLAQQIIANGIFASQAIKNPVPFQPVSLGSTVNTDRPEYLPSLTANGRFLVYTTRVDPQNEDIYYSEKLDTSWSVGQPLAVFNTPYNDSSPSISANGKAMAFARSNQDGNFDIYFSVQQNGEWTTPERLPDPISTSAWESQPCLSADGRWLYFVSDRAGGIGKLDLWVSEREANGGWSAPMNLGPSINTTENEQGPFLHPDGQTLYFMSKGHPGMGAYDLYLSRLDAAGEWSTAENLGYPINTKNNEGALIVSLDGKIAYFDTDQYGPTGKYQEMGNADLFSFELHDAIRPRPTTYVQAIVRDADTKKALVAEVSFVLLEGNSTYADAQTDTKGEFLTVLPLGRDYALNVSREGYLFHSENFALKTISSIDEPFMLEIDLVPIPQEPAIEAHTPVVLKNVFFNTGSSDLLPASLSELQRLKQLLEENPGLAIQINGHTDNIGSEEDNLELSTNRAKAVHDYLIEEGIGKERLKYIGYGEGKPIADNATEEGRQQNRRTTFIITP